MRVEELIGRRIRAERERLELTQEQLGQRLGERLGRAWPRQAVSAAEKGDRAFTAAELVAIATTLDMSVGGLLMPPAGVADIEMPNGSTLTREDLVDAILPRLGTEKTFEGMQASIRQIAEISEQYRKLGILLGEVVETLNDGLLLARGVREARDRFGQAGEPS